MVFRYFYFAAVAVSILSGCNSSQDSMSEGANAIAIDSRFEQVPASSIKVVNQIAKFAASDLPDFGLSNPTTITRPYNVCDCGYFAQVGKDKDDRFVAISGMVNPEGVNDGLPTSGEAKYSGFTRFIAIDRSGADDKLAVASQFELPVVVRVDFDAGTFRGRTPDNGDKAYQLTFDGGLAGWKLDGTSQLKKDGFNVSGLLEGRIDSIGVLSAFHGNNDEDAFAGGFGAGVEAP